MKTEEFCQNAIHIFNIVEDAFDAVGKVPIISFVPGAIRLSVGALALIVTSIALTILWAACALDETKAFWKNAQHRALRHCDIALLELPPCGLIGLKWILMDYFGFHLSSRPHLPETPPSPAAPPRSQGNAGSASGDAAANGGPNPTGGSADGPGGAGGEGDAASATHNTTNGTDASVHSGGGGGGGGGEGGGGAPPPGLAALDSTNSSGDRPRGGGGGAEAAAATPGASSTVATLRGAGGGGANLGASSAAAAGRSRAASGDGARPSGGGGGGGAPPPPDLAALYTATRTFPAAGVDAPREDVIVDGASVSMATIDGGIAVTMSSGSLREADALGSGGVGGADGARREEESSMTLSRRELPMELLPEYEFINLADGTLPETRASMIRGALGTIAYWVSDWWRNLTVGDAPLETLRQDLDIDDHTWTAFTTNHQNSGHFHNFIIRHSINGDQAA